jgi:hypothetical protein
MAMAIKSLLLACQFKHSNIGDRIGMDRNLVSHGRANANEISLPRIGLIVVDKSLRTSNRVEIRLFIPGLRFL